MYTARGVVSHDVARHHARPREGEIISHERLAAIAERRRATLRGLELADVEVLITAVPVSRHAPCPSERASTTSAT
jgi:hypothetical protein